METGREAALVKATAKGLRLVVVLMMYGVVAVWLKEVPVTVRLQPSTLASRPSSSASPSAVTSPPCSSFYITLFIL